MASRTEMLKFCKRVQNLIKNEYALLDNKEGVKLEASFTIKRVAK